MTSEPALPSVIGAIADDRTGSPLGTVTAVFVDDVTGEPTWVGLTDGLHAAPDPTDIALVAPIGGAESAGGRLRLAVSADAVRTAPRPAQADRLTPGEEETLRAHYSSASRTGAPDDVPADAVAGDAVAQDAVAGDAGAGDAGAGETRAGDTVSGDDGYGRQGTQDTAMTRSEERLRVESVREPWARAVLRIDTVTEEVMVPVTVTRQVARVEYLPLRPGEDTTTTSGAASDATSRAASGTGENDDERSSGWVTLYGERPVVTVERAPLERVRLATSWVTEQQAVSETLRRERIALDSDLPGR
jgi:stress response protein YsnF